MAKGGWTRIMNKVNNANAFYRNWSDFKSGFGDINENHWLGFNLINMILSTDDFMVRFEFENSILEYFEFDLIKIGSESQNFILTLGQLTNYTIKPDIMYDNRSEFRTFDYNTNVCPQKYKAGWWFKVCYRFCSTCSPVTEGHIQVNGKWITYNKSRIFVKRKF